MVGVWSARPWLVSRRPGSWPAATTTNYAATVFTLWLLSRILWLWLLPAGEAAIVGAEGLGQSYAKHEW